MKDVSIDMDSKTGLKGIFSGKGGHGFFMSAFLCLYPSLLVKRRFFLFIAETLEILQVLTTH